jgi:PD-(D/E)XK nuclease superfamily protein
VNTNQVTGSIVDAAMKVHSALGPGLLESVYEKCLKHELRKRGLRVESQIWLPVVYDGVEMEGGYKIDLLVVSETLRQAGGPVDQLQRGAPARWNSQAGESVPILCVLSVLCGCGLIFRLLNFL